MSKPNQPLKAAALVSAIGAELAIMTIAGFYGGRALDRWLGTDPWLLLFGVMLGIAAGIYGVYHLVKPFLGE